MKIGDFGGAKVSNASMASFCTQIGTPYYMAPEVQFNTGTSYSSKVDVWSLGCVLYRLCALKPPFVETDDADLAEIQKEKQFEPLMQKEINEVVKQLLAYDQNKRPDCRQIIGFDWVQGKKKED